MNVYRNRSDLPFRRRLKSVLGNFLCLLRPRLAAEVDERPFTPGWGWQGKLIRNAHLANAVKRRDDATLRRFFTDYWSSATSGEFYEGFADRFENLFLRHHTGIVDQLAEALASGEGPRVRLVEVGSGDGRVLEWVADRLEAVHEFHGVDLNEGEIEKCRQSHRGSTRLFFHAGDIVSWLRENPAPWTVLFTNGGVCEYLLEDELRDLFAELRRLCSPCLVAITESIGSDHDLETEPQSLPYGREFAFSHNYPALLREVGFEVVWEKTRPTAPDEENHPQRWHQLIAKADQAVKEKCLALLPLAWLVPA